MSKYNSKKTVIDGISFDSKKEAERYQELKLLEKAGEISNLRLQPKFELIPTQYEETGEVYKRGKNKGDPKIRVAERSLDYIADFMYRDKSGNPVIEDVKGVKTKEYVIKRKLMRWVHGIKVKEV